MSLSSGFNLDRRAVHGVNLKRTASRGPETVCGRVSETAVTALSRRKMLYVIAVCGRDRYEEVEQREPDGRRRLYDKNCLDRISRQSFQFTTVTPCTTGAFKTFAPQTRVRRSLARPNNISRDCPPVVFYYTPPHPFAAGSPRRRHVRSGDSKASEAR